MTKTVLPKRYDHVGSFLRPNTLKDARTQYKDGTINKEQLTAVENQEIKSLINKQVDAGLHYITDGEFRRSWWHLDFFYGLNGVSFVEEGGYEFHGETTRPGTSRLVGTLSGTGHPFIEHFKFVRDHTPKNHETKQTIPSPSQFIQELLMPHNEESTRAVYPTNGELMEGVVKAYKEFIGELYDEGCRTLQIDDCTWGILLSDNIFPYELHEPLKDLYISVNNRVLEDLPDDLTVFTHVCRGNYHSTWASQGPYTNVADPLFTDGLYDAYYLEYDTERSGGFEPLAEFSNDVTGKDKRVVIGLVTTKDGQLEDKESVIQRIQEASQYIDLDRIYISPQCGFASTEEGNKLTEEDQWAKFNLLKEIADEVWG